MTMPIVADRPHRYTVKDETGRVVGHAELRRVAINSIKIDSAYQRDVSKEWVHRHLPFDAKQAGAIVLSGRAGGPYCIDGGHRLELAKESGETLINAFVIEGLSQRDEAGLFTRYQRERRNLTSFALFRADKVAGDPDTMAMDRVVRAAGFQLGKSASSPNTITAIDSLRYIQRTGGDDLLSDTLKIIRTFWIGEEKALSGQVLKGIALFLQSSASEPNFRPATLDSYLKKTAPVKLLRESQAVSVRRSGAPAVSAANVADAIHEGYNKLVKDDAEKLKALTIGRRRRPDRPWSRA
jgi:hypothetical protein